VSGENEEESWEEMVWEVGLLGFARGRTVMNSNLLCLGKLPAHLQFRPLVLLASAIWTLEMQTLIWGMYVWASVKQVKFVFFCIVLFCRVLIFNCSRNGVTL
jgi:hypothetical protein